MISCTSVSCLSMALPQQSWAPIIQMHAEKREINAVALTCDGPWTLSHPMSLNLLVGKTHKAAREEVRTPPPFQLKQATECPM